jgi:hypothetical protein
VTKNITLININKINEIANLKIKNCAKKLIFRNNNDLAFPEKDCKKNKIRLEVRPISAEISNLLKKE